jgi:hypothetical protein
MTGTHSNTAEVQALAQLTCTKPNSSSLPPPDYGLWFSVCMAGKEGWILDADRESAAKDTHISLNRITVETRKGL